MFKLKSEAELRNINCRSEAHGDEMKRAIDLKFVAIDAPADQLDGAINGFLGIYYDKDGGTIGGESYPLRVRHKIEAAAITVSQGRTTVTFKECVIKGIQLTPKTGKRTDCTFIVQVSDYPDGVMDKLTKWQREVVSVDVEQRQMKLDDMEQRRAAAA